VANPTRTALQQCLASLESAEHGVAFASGLGAVSTIMHLLNPGDRTVLIADVYGGVYRMTSQVYEPKGYVFDYLPAADFDDLATHLDERTRIVWIETPSNPLLNIVDIEKAAEAAHAAGALLVVDNTFATPYLQRPLEFGRTSSCTRRPSISADTRTSSAASPRRTIRRSPNAFVPPEVPWGRPEPVGLLARAAGNQDARCTHAPALQNAHALSGFLERHPRVEQTLYPGLPRHPGHAIAAKQMHDFGGMISFLAESEEEATAFVASTKIFKLAESLGGVESLIELPARMTHASTADAPFAARGT